MFFKQIQQHSDNFSYIVADEEAGEAAVVDSSFNASEIIKIVKAKGFKLNTSSTRMGTLTTPLETQS